METHSSILAWKILWTEDLVFYSSRGHEESDTTVYTHTQAARLRIQPRERIHFNYCSGSLGKGF